MTRLSGEFQTDLAEPDALEACAEAIHGLGWRIENVEAGRIVSHTQGPKPATIELELEEAGPGTDVRIVGSDSEEHPLDQQELISHLERARDSIQESIRNATVAAAEADSGDWLPPDAGEEEQDAGEEEQDAGESSSQDGLRKHWRGPVIALVALLIGLAIGASSGSSTTTSTSTVARTNTVTQAPSPSTVTSTVQAAAPAANATSTTSGGAKHYKGSGTLSLGGITIGHPSTLRWTDTGGGVAHLFSVQGISKDFQHQIAVSSQAKSGTSKVSPGTYQDVQVIGDDWTITITPG